MILRSPPVSQGSALLDKHSPKGDFLLKLDPWYTDIARRPDLALYSQDFKTFTNGIDTRGSNLFGPLSEVWHSKSVDPFWPCRSACTLKDF